MVELGICKRGGMTCKARIIYYLALYTCSLMYVKVLLVLQISRPLSQEWVIPGWYWEDTHVPVKLAKTINILLQNIYFPYKAFMEFKYFLPAALMIYHGWPNTHSELQVFIHISPDTKGREWSHMELKCPGTHSLITNLGIPTRSPPPCQAHHSPSLRE